MPKLTNRSYLSRTDVRSYPNYRKASLLKTLNTLYKRINHFNFLGARGTVKEINADSTTKYDGSATTTTGKLLIKPNFINQSPS